MNMDNSERTEVSAGAQSDAATVAEGSSAFVECAGKIPRDHQERFVPLRAAVEGFGQRRDHSGPGEVAPRGGPAGTTQ